MISCAIENERPKATRKTQMYYRNIPIQTILCGFQTYYHRLIRVAMYEVYVSPIFPTDDVGLTRRRYPSALAAVATLIPKNPHHPA